MNVFAARKILMALLLLAVALGITYVKGDVPSNLLSFMEVLFGTFVLGNSVEHYTKLQISNNNASESDSNDKT